MSLLLFSLGAGAVTVSALLIVYVRPSLIIDHPRTVLALVAAISLGALALLVRLAPLGFTIAVDPASEPLIPAGDPGIPIYAQATLDFGSDDVYVIAMEVQAGDVFSHANLQTLRTLTHQLRGLPGIAEVESLARVPYIHYDEAEGMVSAGRFFREVPESESELAELRRRALRDPVYAKTLISADGRTAAINITFRPMSDTEFVALDLDGRIEAMLAELSGDAQRFYIAGRPHVRSKAHHIMVSDLAFLVPVAVVVAAFVLFLMSGSLFGVLIPLAACVLSTLWVYGAMAILGSDINLISLVLGPIMICIGSVYGVHVYARFELIEAEVPSDSPGAARAAALASLEYARAPVLMAGFTTSIGFAALLLNDIPATGQLGGFAIIGVIGVTVLSLTAVPASLALLASSGVAAQSRNTRLSRWFGEKLEGVLSGLGWLATERSTPVLLCWALISVAALLAIPRIQIDTDFISFFLADDPVKTDFAAVNRLMTGVVPIYVMVEGNEEGIFREPSTLRALERLQGELEAIEGVTTVLSSVDLIKLANQAMKDGDPSDARIPDTRREVAEATFILPKSKLRRFSTSNHARANLIVRSDRSGSRGIRAVEAQIEEVLARSELPEGFTTAVTGNSILLNRGADSVASNQATQVGLAAGTILVLIVLVFRSTRVGLISMVPNIVPVLVFFGILGAGVAPLSLPTSLIGCIALGIAIDDTMHFLVAYQAQRARGMTPEAAARLCIQKVGRPIVMTSIMLVVGFLVILASGFATLREFGYLTALTMAICLTTDLILLPALLVRLRA